MSYVDEYLDGLDEGRREQLQRVRDIVREVVPEVEEGRSYGMPALLLEERPLLGFRVAKEHLSVFPFSPAAIDSVRDRLGDFGVSKGTIRFRDGQEIPEDVLRDLVRARREELMG